MAGVKGRSGGARPGAGRKKKAPEPLIAQAQAHGDPLEFLRSVMNDPLADGKLRVDAAKALMPYVHERKGGEGELGKKKARELAAQTADQGSSWEGLLQ